MSQRAEPYFDIKDRVWYGKTRSLQFHKDASLGSIALAALQKHPDKANQVCDTTGDTLTGRQMATLSIRVAQYFQQKLGLQQEDVIGIMASSTTYKTPVVLGSFLSGTTISPIHCKAGKEGVKLVFGLTQPKIVFCDADCYNELLLGLKDINLPCKIYILKGHINGVDSVHEILKETGFEDDFTPVVLKNGGEQTAAILSTSGTTGNPKGVCKSHRNLLNKANNENLSPEDIIFTHSSISWITGLIVLVASSITGALRVITDQPFSPEFYVDLIERHKINQILTNPAQIALLLRYPDINRRDLSTVKSFVSSGLPLSVSAAEEISKLFIKNCFYVSYGMTEFGGGTCSTRFIEEKKGSVGQLMANMRARILSEDGNPMGIGELGEIHLQDAYNWDGYYKNPELTRLAADDQGWFITGDLGYFDEDGFLFLTGRKQDMLMHKNILIPPKEIEDVIQKIPGVVEVCVFGMRDRFEHDLATAAVIKSEGCNLTEEEICETVARCLPKIKHLRGGVHFVQEFPRTISGKVQKLKLQAMFR